MAGSSHKKRSADGKAPRPSKKQRRQQAYNSDSDEDEQDFDGVNLLDSDDDILNAHAEEVDGDDNKIGSGSESDDAGFEPPQTLAKGSLKAKKTSQSKSTQRTAKAESEDDDDEDDGDEDEQDTESEIGDDEFDLGDSDRKPKKRNDPSAFATSLSKILSTKLSTSKRADPVLARSAEAHESSKAAVDSVLEAKAKRQIREQKRKAMERGRVKDVLVAPPSDSTGIPEMTTADILAIESKLRKVAQRGVVKMFNAVRAAQVKSAEAERSTKQAGVIGMARRDEKVNEMTKKGFLELIASGGGGLKKGAIEEA